MKYCPTPTYYFCLSLLLLYLKVEISQQQTLQQYFNYIFPEWIV